MEAVLYFVWSVLGISFLGYGKPFWGGKGLFWVRSVGQFGMWALYVCFG